MSVESTRIYTEEEIKDMKEGKANLAGFNLNLNKILGEKVAEEFLSQITTDHLKVIYDYMIKDIWKEDYNKKPILNYKTGSYGSQNPPDMATYAKREFENAVKQIIQDKILEYVNSEEYKKKAENIAKEIMDYAVNGYKEDMISVLRKRLLTFNLIPDFEYASTYNTEVLGSRIDNLEKIIRENIGQSSHY